MIRRYLVYVIGLVFVSSFNFASASVVINEVQISPTGDRFIELYNQDESDVNLTDWYIQRKTETGTSFSSLVSSTNFENKKIKANEYFLISRSLLTNSDIVVSTMTLTESNVIQIKNQNGDVVDKICWGNVSDCVSVVANPTEGKSVARGVSGLFIGTPTPKTENQASTVGDQPAQNTQNETEDNPPTSPASGSSASSSAMPEGKIITTVIGKSVIFAGLATDFKLSVIGRDKQPLFYGRYILNFGDGSYQELKVNSGQNINHTYFYPGEYSVTLEYYINSYGEIPDAVDKIKVKVTSADVLISKVGDEKDFFIEITNNTGNDVDISKWILVSGDKRFIFPKNTNILAKNKIIFSPFVTGFNISDKNNLKLVNQDWKTIFDYGATITSVVNNTNSFSTKVPSNIVNKAVASNFSGRGNKEQTIPESILYKDIEGEDLGARALQNGFENTKNNYLYLLILFLLIGGAGGAVYFIRKQKTNTEVGDDFDILEE